MLLNFLIDRCGIAAIYAVDMLVGLAVLSFTIINVGAICLAWTVLIGG